MGIFVWIALLMIFIIGILLLWREGLLKDAWLISICSLLLLIALLLRARLFYFRSGDYNDFLLPWVEFFRSNGGFRALGQSIGNYNLPYLYFLALFSYLDISELYLIKLLSVLFDILLAWACMKLVSVFRDGTGAMLCGFFGVLFLPTVILNGAYWGQCDSIYCFFAVLSIYLMLTGKPVGSMLAIAASFAFKLQAVFIMPVFFIFLICGKIKLRQLFVFPAAYVLYILPAVIAGRDFWDTLTLYISQADTVGSGMNYNAPSFSSMFSWQGDISMWSRTLILAAFAFVFICFFIAFIKRRSIKDIALFAFAAVFSLAVPYLLPHMHDRYFYLAGAMLVCVAVCDLRFAFAALFAEAASLHCYYAYLKGYYLVQPRLGGIAMLIALLILLIFLAICLEGKKFKKLEICS